MHTDARVMPIVSDDWTRFSSWCGEGAAPAGELARLSDLVETVHAHGQRLRMWATPDRPGAQRTALWTTLLDLGVDLINTDDLSGLAAGSGTSPRKWTREGSRAAGSGHGTAASNASV